MENSKYHELIDTETWAFINETLSYYPADTEDQPIEVQRRIYNEMCRQLSAKRPAGVVSNDYEISINTKQNINSGQNNDSEQTIGVREYQLENTQATAQVLYFHGGGFVVGDLESHDDICAEICAKTGFIVTAVDYRLAPEHIYPAAFDDASASFQHVIERHQLPMILVGDSAGANLAASVASRSRTLKQQAIGQVLIYPGLGGDTTQGSYVEHADAPMLSTYSVLFYRDTITGGDQSVINDPGYAPLRSDDFSGLPSTVIFTAQCDPLASDGPNYCENILAAGGSASCTEEAGLVHGYLRARHSTERAKDSFKRIIHAIKGFIQ